MLSVHPPNEEINENKLQEIIKQFPVPFIILGDFNCYSTLWGYKNTNQEGKNLETLIYASVIISPRPTYALSLAVILQ